MVGAESSWIAGELAEAADEGAVVHCFFRSLMRWSIAKSVDDVFEGSVEGLREIERAVQDTICHLFVVRSDLIDADRQPPQTAIEHKNDLGSIATRSRVGLKGASVLLSPIESLVRWLTGVKELLCRSDAIPRRFVPQLYPLHDE